MTCNVCRRVVDRERDAVLTKHGLLIVRCPGCRLLFRAELPDATTLDEIYDEAYFSGKTRDGYLDYVADADVHRLNARRRLTRISRLTPPGKLLDVGCAAGFFVDEAERAGWTSIGVDVSSGMVEWGRAHTRANLTVGTLRDLPADESSLTCVTMWDYLEHALDPRADIENAFSRLLPGGVIAISTGDANSLLARLSLERWHLMTPRHHNYFFSQATLARLLASTGYQLLEIRRPAVVYPMRYLAHKACMMLSVGILDAAANRLARSKVGGLAVPFNLWDVLTVIAQRPEA